MKISHGLLSGAAAVVLAGCQSGGADVPQDVSSYEYCMRDHARLEEQYRTGLESGYFSRSETLVQPRNISDKCLVRMWSQGKPGSYDLTWNGACDKGYASGLGLVTLYSGDGSEDSIRLYEGHDGGQMTAYFGLSESSGKIWYGVDDGHEGRFFVSDLGREEHGGEYALSRLDYDSAQTVEFIYSDEGSAAVRMRPNFSEMYSRSYSEGNYVSDLFYALYEFTPEGHSSMTGVGFVLSGHGDDLEVLDVSSANVTGETSEDVLLNEHYLTERLDGEKELFYVRRNLNAMMPEDLKTARSKLKEYQRMVCREKQYDKLHLSASEAAGICVLKARIPARFVN